MKIKTIKTVQFDCKSISMYFTFKGKRYWADLADVKYLGNEFMVFECNQRGVVNYDGVYQDYFDAVSKKNLLKGVRNFKKRIVKHN